MMYTDSHDIQNIKDYTCERLIELGVEVTQEPKHYELPNRDERLVYALPDLGVDEYYVGFLFIFDVRIAHMFVPRNELLSKNEHDFNPEKYTWKFHTNQHNVKTLKEIVEHYNLLKLKR